MTNKLKKFYAFLVIVVLPASVYLFVTVKASGNDINRVENVSTNARVSPILPDSSNTISLAKETVKPVVKKPIVKKPVAKKKAVKKKVVKRKEKLTVAPPIITPETAPHTAR